MDFGGSWEDHLPLVEFAYNNSYHSAIQMAPFEALYGRPCRTPILWEEVGEAQLVGPQRAQQDAELVRTIRRRMSEAQDRQKSYADQRRRPLEFSIGDHIFLKVSPTKGVKRFGLRGKLAPPIYWVIPDLGEDWSSSIPSGATTISNRHSRCIPCIYA